MSRPPFDEVVSSLRGPVYRYCLAVCPDAATAEDLLQDTFVAAFRAYDGFRGDAAVKTWLLTIARNRAHRMLKKRAGEPDQMQDLMELGLRAGWGTDDCLERQITQGEERLRLQRALSELEPAEREILVLRELEELTTREVSDVLGISPGAVRVRLHRARLRLVAKLRTEGGTRG